MSLEDYDKLNFETLLEAAENGDLCVMQVRRRSDGKEIAAVCAVNHGTEGAEDEFAFIPLATMVEGNPFELFDPPAPEGGYYAEEPE